MAELVWERFGDVASYNEPFAGSLAVLLGRPHKDPGIETVNDLDAYIANFWRALQADPEGVAFYADSPVNEADLHARHRWLVMSARSRAEQVRTDPNYYNVKVAGWWVYGQCLWIGSGWCQVNPALPSIVNLMEALAHSPALGGDGEQTHLQRKRFSAPGHGQGNGVHRKKFRAEGQVDQKRFRGDGDSGVHRRWQGGGAGGGSGVHAPSLSQQLPDLSGDAGAAGRGIHRRSLMRPSYGLYDWFADLSARLRRVRVTCGDWGRVLTPSVTTYIGVTGVFLDPPYDHDLRARCYSEDHNISGAVRAWALEHGDDPLFRIALCGYVDEHVMPDTWECVPWKAHGGYSRSKRGVENRDKERVWFSPHCLKPGLFSLYGDAPDPVPAVAAAVDSDSNFWDDLEERDQAFEDRERES